MADSKRLDLRRQIADFSDVQLFFALLVLWGIGITMVTSSTVEMGYRQHDDAFFYVKKQMLFLLLGLLCIFMLSKIRLVYWERLGPLILMASILLLMMVLIPGVGRTVNASSRWLAIGPVTIQVSEFAKIAMIIYLAGYIVRHGASVQQKFSAFINPMLLVGVISVLLMLEPDFGSSVVLTALVFIMLYLGGVRLAPFVLSTVCSIMVLYLIAISNAERWSRVTSFWRPFEYRQGDGYQLSEALIAIGSGGVFGQGPGESIQKLFYLPYAHNDFIFAVTAEELGLLGVAVLLSAYLVLIWRCFRIAASAQAQKMRFAQHLAYGCGIWFLLQSAISIGVNMGILPTKGLSLPFLSVGGSNLLAACIAVGLLMRVYIEVNQQGAQRVTRPKRKKAKRAG